MRDRDDSPWYASVRLFRQQRQGDWSPVIARVNADVDRYLASSARLVASAVGPPE
jgi:hypothetical protein